MCGAPGAGDLLVDLAVFEGCCAHLGSDLRQARLGDAIGRDIGAEGFTDQNGQLVGGVMAVHIGAGIGFGEPLGLGLDQGGIEIRASFKA